MAKPEISGSLRSTYTRVVCLVCEEKGIDYALLETPLRAPALFAIHPLGKMPVLRHGDLTLFESKAIATYLDSAFPGPRLIPADPRRAALVEQWVSFVNTAVDRTVIRTYLYAYIAPKTADGSPDRAAIEAVLPELRQQVAELTFADLNLLPLLHRLGQAPEGAETLAEARHLAAYYARHAARPSFQRTIPPAAPPSAVPSPSARPQGAPPR